MPITNGGTVAGNPAEPCDPDRRGGYRPGAVAPAGGGRAREAAAEPDEALDPSERERLDSGLARYDL